MFALWIIVLRIGPGVNGFSECVVGNNSIKRIRTGVNGCTECMRCEKLY
jgi:hypothetical protein